MSILAAAAKRDISPAKPVALFGYPHVRRISQSVHDPLYASVLCLKNGGRTVALISLDILMLEPPLARSLRRAVAARLGTDEACVFINCTHTHSAPVTACIMGWQEDETIPAPDAEYIDYIKEQTVAAAAAASETLRPAEIAWTTADAKGVGGNRHSPDGAADPEVGILAVREAESNANGEKQIMALVVDYAMHPTVLHEDSPFVSSDFPHYTRELLAERFGDRLTVVYQNGPSGNQSPRYFVNGQTFAEAQRLGEKLGRAVAEALERIGDEKYVGDCRLWSRLAEVELPRRPIPSVAEAEKLLAEYQANYRQLQDEAAPRAAVRTAECAIFGAESTLSLAKAQQSGQIERTLAEYRPLEVQAVGVGDVKFVGLPGECFTEYALMLKRRAGKGVFVVSLVNGELQGYIVTPEAARAGGYEATNSLFAPEAGRILVDAALTLLADEKNP